MTLIPAGMIGGGRGAFIGAVHRRALALDGRFVLVAGALSSDPERALASGRDLGLDPGRTYPTWQAMLEGERARPAGSRIRAVVIVTPNDSHAPIACAFAQAGFHIMCDKPMCVSSTEAQEIITSVERAGVAFGVSYNYSGYPMVIQARHMVRAGLLGRLRRIVVEYHQGWLSEPLEQSGHKQAAWRTDPARAGPSGALGDIGSHAEHLVWYITGLEPQALCADLTTFVEGRRLDDDAAILLRYAEGVRGVLLASQIEAGHDNDLRIRISGEAGSLQWRQERPDELLYRPAGAPVQVLRRGHEYLCAQARTAARLPPGHPEGFIEALANLYQGLADQIERREGRLTPGAPAQDDRADCPTVYDGARGVRFIEAAIASSRLGGVWVVLDA